MYTLYRIIFRNAAWWDLYRREEVEILKNEHVVAPGQARNFKRCSFNQQSRWLRGMFTLYMCSEVVKSLFLALCPWDPQPPEWWPFHKLHHPEILTWWPYDFCDHWDFDRVMYPAIYTVSLIWLAIAVLVAIFVEVIYWYIHFYSMKERCMVIQNKVDRYKKRLALEKEGKPLPPWNAPINLKPIPKDAGVLDWLKYLRVWWPRRFYKFAGQKVDPIGVEKVLHDNKHLEAAWRARPNIKREELSRYYDWYSRNPGIFKPKRNWEKPEE